jgi:ppGpp synthetase/RelA/SpoT-type nucleotidyltranferase
MSAVQAKLIDLGLRSTSRLKTRETLVEKLRRERTRLSSIDDIAGVRVVRKLTLSEQTRLAERVASAFPGARVKDRRTAPSSGYRAIHVIAVLEGYHVEIQIRTRWQNFWAQLFEAYGDRWGRQIRYGGEPFSPDLVHVGEFSRREVVQFLKNLSQLIAGAEEQEDLIARISSFFNTVDVNDSDDPELIGLQEDYERAQVDYEKKRSLINDLMASFDQGTR